MSKSEPANNNKPIAIEDNENYDTQKWIDRYYSTVQQNQKKNMQLVDFVLDHCKEDDDSNFITHAKRELSVAGLDKPDSMYKGMIAESVMRLIRLFALEGHSGYSAALTTQIFNDLIKFNPLTPLTGDDDEWNECATGLFQNKRCEKIFKENGVAYNSEGRVFHDTKDDSYYTALGSCVEITFPYTMPEKPEIVEV